jgi:hypothetical protein
LQKLAQIGLSGASKNDVEETSPKDAYRKTKSSGLSPFDI